MDNQLDPLIPKYLVTAIQDAFGVQASTTIKIHEVKLVDASTIPSEDLVAAIGISSSKLSGTLALCFSEKVFLGVVNRMLGETYQKIDGENADAAGELLNIIYASARAKLNSERGHDFSPAIPTVARGKQIQLSHRSTNVIQLNCDCEFGPFHMEVSFKNKS